MPDPGAAGTTDAELERAFRDACFTLERRIELFLSLPLHSLETLAIHEEVHRIGRESALRNATA
jgi:hypothetical protein